MYKDCVKGCTLGKCEKACLALVNFIPWFSVWREIEDPSSLDQSRLPFHYKDNPNEEEKVHGMFQKMGEFQQLDDFQFHLYGRYSKDDEIDYLKIIPIKAVGVEYQHLDGQHKGLPTHSNSSVMNIDVKYSQFYREMIDCHVHLMAIRSDCDFIAM